MELLRITRQRDVAGRLLVHHHDYDLVGRTDRATQAEQPSQPDLLLEVVGWRSSEEGSAQDANRDAGRSRRQSGHH
jgi:hypothetical protein